MTPGTSENNAIAPLVQEKTEEKLIQQKNEITQQDQNNLEESKEDPNWRAFREARKKDRAEKEAAERRAAEKEAEATALKAAMEAAFARNPAPQQQQNEYGYQQEDTEDERIEKKVQTALAQREAAAQQQQQQREQQEYPNRLVQTYPDFNSIVTSENLDYLEYHYPEVTRPLRRHAEGYDKWSDIYHAVKKFVPNSTTARKEAAKAEANFSKPKSISSTGLTQNTQTSNMQLSEDRKAANWARMQQVMKGVS